MKRIIGALAVVAVLPWLIGATCVLTQISNPAPPANLREDGTFTLGVGEGFDYVSGHIVRTGFPEFTADTIATHPQGPGTWRAEFSVGAGNYTCWGKLHYTVGNPPVPQTKTSNALNGDFL